MSNEPVSNDPRNAARDEGIEPTPVPAPEPVPGVPSGPPAVPMYLKVWRAVWGTSPTPGGGEGPHPPTDGFREIVETLVFVVVLVLMLRCFVAEAFVIPTGSMAETLYGYQKIVTCSQCKFTFPVNCADEVEPRVAGGEPTVTSRCICPNCMLKLQLVPPGTPLTPSSVPDPGYSTGDRVLVAKFLYDLFGRRPDRLDVVVFKFPGDDPNAGFSGWPSSGPQKRGVPMNYIKRLVGLPGETMYIYRGDLYASIPDPTKWQAEDFADCTDDASREARKLMLWRSRKIKPEDPDYTHTEIFNTATANKPGSRYDEALKLLVTEAVPIVRKPADKILAERRIVNDHDHLPDDLVKAGAPTRWKNEDEEIWKARGSEFQGAGGKSAAWVRYRHLLRDMDTTPQYIKDFLAYNSQTSNSLGTMTVKDLILECEVQVEKAEGEFAMELSAGVDRFRAVWNLADGFCTLYRFQPQGTVVANALGMEKVAELASKPTRMKGPGTYRLRFANVDKQLVVWVDGSLPFGPNGVAYPPPTDPSDVKENDLYGPASFGVQGGAVTVRHISLWRDVYYLTGGGSIRHEDGETEGQIKSIYVQPGHYLCLGDNSAASSDSRSWGLVPDRLLLGKAQLVYFPFYFPWPPIKAPVNRVGLIH